MGIIQNKYKFYQSCSGKNACLRTSGHDNRSDKANPNAVFQYLIYNYRLCFVSILILQIVSKSTQPILYQYAITKIPATY